MEANIEPKKRIYWKDYIKDIPKNDYFFFAVASVTNIFPWCRTNVFNDLKII